MVEAVGQTNPIKPFTTIKYQTQEGEHISATKNNGIVTLVGDKNGTRQMPLDDFIKNELPKAVSLESSPKEDSVEIGKTPVTNPAKADVTPQFVNNAKPDEVKDVTTGKKLDVTV